MVMRRGTRYQVAAVHRCMLFISTSRELGVRRTDRVTFQHAYEKAMRHCSTVALVRNPPGDYLRARHTCVEERVGCPVRLKPVHIVEIPQSHFRALPSVPFSLNVDQRFVDWLHDASRRSLRSALFHYTSRGVVRI